jgi:hypothetical protein
MKNQTIMQVQIPAPNDQSIPGAQTGKEQPLTLQDALQIKAAKYWLKLGEADVAIKELEALPTRIWKCGCAIKTRLAAIGALSGRDEFVSADEDIRQNRRSTNPVALLADVKSRWY